MRGKEGEAEKVMRKRLVARDEGLPPSAAPDGGITFNQWADWFLENRSRPPFRSENTHRLNLSALKFLRPRFGKNRLSDITPEEIESYLMTRLNTGKRVHTKLGLQLRGRLKPATVHQEFRILRRILNVAVKKRRLAVNPCVSVEFPVALGGHDAQAALSDRLGAGPAGSLRSTVPAQHHRDHGGDGAAALSGVDPDAEGAGGSGERGGASAGFQDGERHCGHADDEAGPGSVRLPDEAERRFRLPVSESAGGVQQTAHHEGGQAVDRTLQRAGLPHFSLYELRHTFATRLSAGGVADHFVTQMLRQGDSQVFKRYSQAKLNMMREALSKLDRQANEHGATCLTALAG